LNRKKTLVLRPKCPEEYAVHSTDDLTELSFYFFRHQEQLQTPHWRQQGIGGTFYAHGRLGIPRPVYRKGKIFVWG
jgi:hypothetical protein